MRRLIQFLLLFALAPQFSGCLAVVAGAAVGGYYLGKDKRPFEQVALDTQTTARVKTALLQDPRIKALDIDVDTYEGIVSLRGEVENSRLSALAIAVTSSTKGVIEVKSSLKVAPVSIREIHVLTD